MNADQRPSKLLLLLDRTLDVLNRLHRIFERAAIVLVALWAVLKILSAMAG